MKLVILFFALFAFNLYSSNLEFSLLENDTTKSVKLEALDVIGKKPFDNLIYLSDIEEAYLTIGKKNEVILLEEMPINLAEKVGRQIFSKVPGAFVYDMDGSGNQVNVSVRGLDPHRGWEFNVRQNGIITNTDMYGYPASHYSMPMEAVSQIEIIRGTSATQYGAQFGGLLNYQIKTGDTTKPLSFESINTAGSFGLFSSYNAIGGKVGKTSYYAYFQRRYSDGYRDNAESNSDAQYIKILHEFSDVFKIRAEIGRSNYVFRLPGPLSDEMFEEDPRQATRQRNFYQPDIVVPSLTIDWQINDNTKVNWIMSGVFGERSSVTFDGFSDVADVINPETNAYPNRNVHIDNYYSRTTELRLVNESTLFGKKNILATGLMYYNNKMHRRQGGKGTSGIDYDRTVIGEYNRDLYYKTQSFAAFFENAFFLTDRFSISPTARIEIGESELSGRNEIVDETELPKTIEHNLPALGINFQYEFNSGKIYGGFAQAHRIVPMKDVVQGSPLQLVDPDLKNSTGYNAEIGVRGYFGGKISYDITLFQLQYNDRPGNLVTSVDGQDYFIRSNIGNSQTNGVEMLIEYNIFSSNNLTIDFFTSTAIMVGEYQDAELIRNGENVEISGNTIENVPLVNSRNGLDLVYKKFGASVLFSYQGESYSDPLNTEVPLPNGSAGKVPEYYLLDLNMFYNIMPNITLTFGINNIADRSYFTKRPLFYPGPGIWSSDGRAFVGSVRFNF